jgi:predicted signal transduction protein with EAL and GGDEF domain
LVAEGVEERGQVEHLLRLGCDRAQGFLLGRPMPHDMLEELVRAQAASRPSPTEPPGPNVAEPRHPDLPTTGVPAANSADSVPAAG